LLYAFARSQMVKLENAAQSFVNIDCAKVSLMEVAWTLGDSGPAHFKGQILAGKSAADAVLEEAIQILAERQMWNIRFNLIRLLRNVIILED